MPLTDANAIGESPASLNLNNKGIKHYSTPPSLCYDQLQSQQKQPSSTGRTRLAFCAMKFLLLRTDSQPAPGNGLNAIYLCSQIFESGAACNGKRELARSGECAGKTCRIRTAGMQNRGEYKETFMCRRGTWFSCHEQHLYYVMYIYLSRYTYISTIINTRM